MKTKFLYELPGIAFDAILRNVDNNNPVDFTIEWINGEITKARMIILKTSSYEQPTMVFVTFKSRESKLILLKNPPKLSLGKMISDDELEIYSTLEVGKMEGTLNENQDGDQGFSVKLYLEFRTSYGGIKDLTNPKERLSNQQSYELEKLGYNLYWSSSYLWYKEFFESVEGEISPLRDAVVI